MLKYIDEINVKKADCSKEHLRNEIKNLEVEIYGHRCRQAKTMPVKKIFSVKTGKIIKV